MTNGEIVQKVFNCEVCEPIIEDDIIHVIFADKKESAIGFDWSWWNAEYKEPTTKNNKVDCDEKYCNNCVNHNYCDYEPTTKNDLGVETTQMIDKSNFSQEQYKADLQSAYDCGYAQAKNDVGADCVSRILVQSAISKSIEYKENPYQLYKRIERLPSVTPQEPKIGHWIPTYGNVKCSVCGSVKDSREVGKATHYCDFCGAKMIGEI